MRLWRGAQPKKTRRASIIPLETQPFRDGLKADEEAIYARSQKRDHRQRDRALFLERERRYRARLPLAVRQRRSKDYNLKFKFGKGFGIVQYEAVLVAQLGGCAICGRDPVNGKPLFVDHDHSDGRVRGLLCHLCNQAMAAVDAVDGWAERAAAYKARHSEGH